MIEEIVEITPPNMMVISPFSSNINNKLRHLASSIKNAKEGDIRKIYIIPFTDVGEGGIEIKKIRIKDDIGSWCEFSPYNPTEGQLIERPVSVNMYDFYNVVDNSSISEFLTLWIDEDTNELVLNSFYNPDIDSDELEVRFKLLPISDDDIIVDNSITEDPIHSFRLDSITTTMIMKELNIERDGGGLTIMVRDGKMYFQNSYHGLITQMIVNNMNDQVFEEDFSIYIPFNVFQLMISTGYVYELQFNYYSNGRLSLETDEYKFYYLTTPKLDDFTGLITDLGNDAEDYFVIDAEMAETSVSLINRLNKSAQITNILINYIDPTCAEFYCKINNRMSISSHIELAMLCNKSFTIDSDIFQEITSKTGVDAVRVKRVDDNRLYIKYENKTIAKEMIYNHDTFSKYRKIKLEEWKRKNE